MKTIVLSILFVISNARPQEEQNSEPNYDNYYYENYDTSLGDYEIENSGKFFNYYCNTL